MDRIDTKNLALASAKAAGVAKDLIAFLSENLDHKIRLLKKAIRISLLHENIS